MAEPFLAEIRIVGFNFPPRGWAQCDGQILPINQNQSLYSLLGNTYGGNGSSFALPELRGRVPIHEGTGAGLSSRTLGQKGGEENHTLLINELPAHQHSLRASEEHGDSSSLGGKVLASNSSDLYKQNPTVLQNMSNSSVSSKGSGQSHNNMQPSLALNFCIALTGLFPSRN